MVMATREGRRVERPANAMIATFEIMSDLPRDDRMAIWMLRYLAGPGRPFCRLGHGGLADPFFRRDIEALGAAFRCALDRLSGLGMKPLDVRIRGCRAVSDAEWRLLRATSAAQRGDEALTVSVLQRLFSHHHVLVPFVAAVNLLAACLATAGYWLLQDEEEMGTAIDRGNGACGTGRENASDPAGADPAPVAAPSLVTMARWRKLDMDSTQVLWPAVVAHSSSSDGRALR